jgi:L-fuculose-phosphate aldolase
MDLPWTERNLRKLMVKACAALERKGLVAATDGNITARLGPDRILVTPSGTSKGEIGELDILVCDGDGRKIRGKGEISSEIHVHLACYRAREDIGGVVHAHPPTATAFTYAGQDQWLAQPIVPEVVAQIGPIPTVPYMTPGTRALAEAVGPYTKQCDIVMMAQHGAVAVGKDPWAAYLRMEKLEQFASIIKAARELAGDDARVKKLSDDQCDALRASYGKGKLSGKNADTRETAAGGAGAVNDELIARITTEVLQKLGRAG